MADIALTAAKIGVVNPLGAEIFSVIAVEAITKGQAVYFTTAGLAGVADANVANKQQCRGIALNAVGAGQAVDVLKRGMCYGYTLTSQSHDDPVFLTDTAGSLGDAAGTLTVPVGLVAPLADKDLTKVVYIDAQWGADWA
jgi:hypothetical protein